MATEFKKGDKVKVISTKNSFRGRENMPISVNFQTINFKDSVFTVSHTKPTKRFKISAEDTAVVFNELSTILWHPDDLEKINQDIEANIVFGKFVHEK